MHSPDHLMQQAKEMKLDGLYPEVREVLRGLIVNMAVIEKELMKKAEAMEGLPAEVEERVVQLEDLTIKHDELYAIHQAMRVRADKEHAALSAVMDANKALIDKLTTRLAALEMDLEDVAAADAPLREAIDMAAGDIATLKLSVAASLSNMTAALNGKKNYVPPAGAVTDVAGAALKADYSVVGGLISTLTLAVNATNARVNEDTAKLNAILAALRAHGIIMS